MKSQIDFKDFAANQVNGLLFFCLITIVYLYIDTKTSLTNQIKALQEEVIVCISVKKKINNRFIKSSYLNHSVNAAFEGLLRPNTHASYFLYLTVNPKSIDINIHPTKTEIKFDDEHTMYAILRSAVKHSLGQFSIAPILDFKKDI